MIVSKNAIPRRTVLRGIGATIALPLLDAMVPALRAIGKTAAKGPSRLGVVYVPNGVPRMEQHWTPAAAGADFELPSILQPLSPFRNRLTVLSGLNSTPPATPAGQDPGLHARASTRFLTDVPPKFTTGSDLLAGISMDQIAAREIGEETQLASLELSMESTESAGTCDQGYSCAYTSTIAWRSPSTPLPMENDPRAVFERLFGDSGNTDQAERLARLAQQRSILDSITDKASRLGRALGSDDRAKLTEYLDAIRDVERRISNAERQNTKELPIVEHPAGIPGTFEEHAKIMYDLQVLAFQTDLTRISTFMMGREFTGRQYPEIGVPDAHHPISHHQNDPDKLAKLLKINSFHVKLFGYFVERLQSIPDGDGTLLDRVLLLYGAGMSDSNAHDPRDLPILLVGGANGRLAGGRHIRCPKGTPLANLHLSVLDMLGVKLDRLGDSTGELDPRFNPLSVA
jgi:Protein of unknown function (DUF1552)